MKNNPYYEYYLKNERAIEFEWEDYLFSKDWGSGEDRIRITDDMFWEFVEERMIKD